MINLGSLLLVLLTGCVTSLSFPPQFSATLRTTAHLIDPASVYPLRNKVMHINYDGVGKRVVANIEGEDKVYIRRYDSVS